MRRKKNKNIIYLTILLISFQTSVFAQSFPIPDPPIIGAKSYLLIDSVTGKDLATFEPDMLLAPASLTKLMTAYGIFNAINLVFVQDVVECLLKLAKRFLSRISS